MIITTKAKQKKKSEDSDNYFYNTNLEISVNDEDLILKFSNYSDENIYKLNMKELHEIIHILED